MQLFQKIISICGLLIFGYTNLILAQSNTILDSLIELSVQLTIGQDYDSAMAVGQQMTAHSPSHPAGALFMAATLQTRMMDFETTEWESAFFDYLKQARVLARNFVEEEPHNPGAHFYLGSVYCYESFFKAKQNKFFAAYRAVRKGMPHLNQAIKLDSTLYDAYLGVGSYFFWRSQKTKSLNWLPFLKDEREKGIAMIRKSIELGKYSRYAAINGLVWVYIELKDYAQAIEVARLGHAEFPESRYFLWCLADAHFCNHDYHQAIHYYQQIIQSLSLESFNNHYNEIVGHLKLAQCFFSLEKYETALLHCNVIENIQLTPDISKKAKKKLKESNRLKEQCEKNIRQTKIAQSSD